ncbi:MAG: hypothetical protein QXU74_03170 [Candidatus Aenigmatarchaeota archaeon]
MAFISSGVPGCDNYCEEMGNIGAACADWYSNCPPGFFAYSGKSSMGCKAYFWLLSADVPCCCKSKSETTTTTTRTKPEYSSCSTDKECESGMKCVTFNTGKMCVYPSKFSCRGNNLFYSEGNIVQACTYCCTGSVNCGSLSACCKTTRCSGTTTSTTTTTLPPYTPCPSGYSCVPSSSVSSFCQGCGYSRMGCDCKAQTKACNQYGHNFCCKCVSRAVPAGILSSLWDFIKNLLRI